MKKYLLTLITITLLVFSLQSFVQADTNSAISYLQANQDATGKITGWGGESDWAAIAFIQNGIDISSVKNPDISLKDFLLNDHPATTSAATDWERKILAIAAMREDPTNFGGIDYLTNLEGYANNNQLGDTLLLNDDIFGLLALIKANSTNDTLKQDVLDFIISHQSSDGGFSWSTNSCDWCGPDSNDTAAAIQALQLAKESGLTHPDLDTSLELAKQYLLGTQINSTGFGYDAYSTDPDGASTSWALMALNALGLSDSPEAQQATTWLLDNQMADDGFPWMPTYGSDTGTTSHALIALSGGWWTQSTPTSTLTPTPIPTTKPTTTPTPTPTVSPTPTPTPTTPSLLLGVANSRKPLPKPTIVPQVLGNATNSATITPTPTNSPVESSNKPNIMGKELASTITIIGGIITFIALLKIREKRS